MSAKLSNVYKVALIASAVCLCGCVWIVLAAIVVVGETGHLAQVSQWLGRPRQAATEIVIAQPLPSRAATRVPGLSPTATPVGATPVLEFTRILPSASPVVSPSVSKATVVSPRAVAPTATVVSTSEHVSTRPVSPGATLVPAVVQTSTPVATLPPPREPVHTPVSAATPTLAPLLTPTATATPTREATHTPPPTASPTPTRDSFNIILLGSDRNIPGKGTWRTDVMALTVIDRETREVGVLAIPRDLYVSIPGHKPERINTVDFLGHYTKYPGGGPALLNETLQQNFGFGFDRFIRVDFAGFVELVDILGGIDVMVDCAFEELFADPDLPGGRLLSVSPGLQHMDGYTALLYVRVRHGTTDTDRSRRQFKVLMAIWDRALQLNTILLLPQLWNNYHTTIQTDLSLIEALDLARVAYEFEPGNMHGRVIDQTMATAGRTAEKAWILIPDQRRIREAYAGLLAAPSLMDAGQRVGRCPGVPTAAE